jgi:hypothetical protein
MGRIKSALELALERTDSVQGDKNSIAKYEAKQNGKKAANEFLDDPANSIDAVLKKTESAVRDAFKEGLFEVFFARLNLPADEKDLKKLEVLGKGFGAVIANTQFPTLFKQFFAAASRYLGEVRQYDEAIKEQYEPELRRKEAELSKRLGQPVRMDPFQDPDFVAFYNKNMSGLKANYEAMLEQVREHIKELAG